MPAHIHPRAPGEDPFDNSLDGTGPRRSSCMLSCVASLKLSFSPNGGFEPGDGPRWRFWRCQMRRLNPWLVAIAAAVTVLALLLLAPTGKNTPAEFNSKAAEGVATGGAPKPPERP